MLCKRIIPCLDVKNGRVVKGVNFANLQDAGDPVALARWYYTEGADELVFLDISASLEKRKTLASVVRNVAREIFVPFTVGGGIRNLKDIEKLLTAGADKVAINTAALQNPLLVQTAAQEFGSQTVVVAIDANKNANRWDVYSYGGQKKTDWDAVRWARSVVDLGAGEILLTSIDSDGTQRGFDIELTRRISDRVSVPVIASGGAGSIQDFAELFAQTNVSAALAASLFHYRQIRIGELKKYLKKEGVEIRET